MFKEKIGKKWGENMQIPVQDFLNNLEVFIPTFYKLLIERLSSIVFKYTIYREASIRILSHKQCVKA